jgi:acetyl esterase/lipase
MGREIMNIPAPPADARLHYGGDPSQFGDLRMPHGKGPHPVAIALHGGFWRAAFDLDYFGHACAALTHAGFATWNVEYRRIGNPGGGWPGTFDDVAAAADHLAVLAAKYPLDLKRVLAIGHSAGGHLALWLAARQKAHRAISLGGVADLKRAWELRLSSGVVGDLLSGSPGKVPDRYRSASPMELLPLHLPQRLIHGVDDDIVPIEIARGYVEKARKLGDDARLIAVEHCGHFELVDPGTEQWATVVSAAEALFVPAPRQ